MTSYRRITSRTINRDIAQQDNMVTFMAPISRAIYPNYFSIPDASNNHLLVSTGSQYSGTASPQLTFNGTTLDVSANLQVDANLQIASNLDVSGNTYLKSLDVSGNLSVYGDTSVQKLNVATNLDVSGNTYLQQLTTWGNILSYGNISARQYLPGQVVNVVMLNNTDLGQTQRSIAAKAITTLFAYSYTPKITNSYLLMEYQSIYTLNGSADDNIEAHLYVDISNNRIAQTYQKWVGAAGGGTRSGTIFPIVGRYTNTATTTRVISVDVFNNTDTDTISVNSDTSTWLKITEIGR